MNRRHVVLAALVAAVSATATASGADILLLKDGRFVEGRKMEQKEGHVAVHFPSGVVQVRDEIVDQVVFEGGAAFVPRTEEEKEKFAKGLVPWEGRWVKPNIRDKKLARRVLTALARLGQHDRRVHLSLMLVLREEGEYAELVRAGETALFIDPENPETHRLLGLGYLHRDKPDRALFELDRALALGHRKPGKIHLERARAFHRARQNTKARRAAKRAVKLDPKLQKQADALLQSLLR